MCVIAIFCMVTFTSCIFDQYEKEQTISDDDDYLMIIRINALDATVSSPNLGDGSEMVKSLRIIMLNDGAIEVNRYVELGDDAAGINMSELEYVFTERAAEGSKKFYLFANEESVGDLEFQSEATLPDDLPTNLHSYLEGIVPNLDDAEAGLDFENIVNAICFKPDYTPDDSGNIYLPYTSYYDGYVVNGENPSNATNPLQMYLVPVATKFIFQFVNYRLNEVEINNITVSKKDSDNFLFARVGESDYNKSFEGTEYYWVNWLAKVSEDSHKNSDFYDNVNFNEKYGWISHYEIPAISSLTDAQFINSSEVKKVPAGEYIPDTDEINPSSLTLGPFYVPESFNKFNGNNDNVSDEEVILQRYYLSLGVHDVTSLAGRDPVFENVTIDNLQALFRNTCVVIKISMSAGDVEVYAEINNWNVKTASGWLVEGNAPSNNPFAN